MRPQDREFFHRMGGRVMDFGMITNFILNFGLVILYLFCLWGATAAIGLIVIFIISLIEFISRPRKGRRK